MIRMSRPYHGPRRLCGPPGLAYNMMVNVTANLAAQICDSANAPERGRQVALREGARAWTYSVLAEKVAKVSAALRTLKIERGERVALIMRDTLELATSVLGVMHAGAIAVPISELATADDLKAYLLCAGCVFAIVETSLEPALGEVRAELPMLREVLRVGVGSAGTVDHPVPINERDFEASVAAASPAKSAVKVNPADVCVLLYSAGTGPDDVRAVPHSHQSIEAAHRSYAQGSLAMSSTDRVLSTARLATAYGLGSGLLFPLLSGAEAALLPEQPRSDILFATVDKFQPTLMFATPSLYGQLARDAAAEAKLKPLSMLRMAVAGAEGLPEQLVSRVRQLLGAELTVGYGLTEIFQFAFAATAEDENAAERVGVGGRPLAGVEARIVDDAGKIVGVDEIGTLQLRCASMFTGYWGGAGTSDSAPGPSRDGWFTTRDRFMLDDAGFYHHCGRIDDLFKVGGKWVAPIEIERALTAHEAVWECAVIGADDEDGFIKPLAFVVPNVGHQAGPELEAELRSYVKQVLSPYKYPRWIEFIAELPRGPSGKVLRYKLKPQRRRRRAETGHIL